MALPDEHPIIPVFPEDGIPWVNCNSAIFKGAEAAAIFLEWLYSDRGQKFIKDINQTIMVSPNLDNPAALKAAPLDHLIDIDLNKFGEDRAKILDEW